MSIKVKWTSRVLSVFLSVLFVIQIVPNQYYAAAGALLKNAFSEEQDSDEPRSPEISSMILGEIVEKRTADTKSYRMSDGTCQILQYPQSVHYETEQGWVEYDNTLQDADAQNLKTTSSDVEIQLAKKTNGKKFVRLEKDGYQIAWYYIGAAKRTGRVSYAEKDGDPTTLERINTEVRYDGVFPDVDLQYILTGNTVKENLILNSASANSVYTIGYQCTGLTPVQQDTRTIYLKNKSDETVFVISAPYMEDQNHAVSEGVSLSISEIKNGKFTLELSLDETWLHQASRAYPVTVDPVLVTSQSWNDTTNCESAYIASGTPSACYGKGGADYEGSLHVGRVNDRGQCRALIKVPNLPPLGIADKVVHAELALYTTECYPDVRVDLHRVTKSWAQNTVCWNSNITYDSKIIDYQLIQTMEHADAGKTRWQRFEITDLVRGWYSGEYANYGVLLRSDKETGSSHARAWFLSSGYPTNSSVRPVLQISYRNMSGYEDYWSYTNLEAGRAGVASVNNYNGNLVYTQPLTNDAGGNLMPVNLSLVYNANGGIAPYTYMGEHVQTNYHMYVRYDSTTAGQGFKYYLNDADGTRHWFYFEGTSNSGKDEDGLGYTLDVTTSVSESDTTNTRYTITDKDKNKMYFNGIGNLIKITNAAGISATVQYETSGTHHRMKSIKDGAGRTYTFGYNPSHWTLCMSITDPGGRKTSFEYYQGTLCWITFPDSKSFELVYDYSRYVLTQIKSVSGMWTKIFYDSSAQKRVTKLQNGADDSTRDLYTFTYKQNATTVTDKDSRSCVYQFNDFGQTTGIVSKIDGTAQFFELEPGNSTSLKANKLLSESKAIKSVTNYLVNPGFTRAFSNGYGTYFEKAVGTRTAAVDSSKSHFTKNSLKVTKSADNGGRVFALQDIAEITSGRYTLSGYINTNGVTLPGNGAYLGIELRNSAGTLVSVAHIEETLKTSGWERRSLTFDVPAGHKLRIIAGFEPTAYGMVWFDDLQVEKGTGESSFNLVENSTFVKGTAQWSSENQKAITVSSGGCLGYENKAKVPGTVEEQYKNIIQSLDVSGKAGDVFSFGMWVSAHSAPIKNGTKDDDAYQPRFDIILHYYDASTGLWKGFIPQDCNPDLKGDWQFVTRKAIIPSDYSRLAIQLVYNHNVNDAYITGAFCYKEEYGQTYTYDNKGNVVSSVDLAKTQSSFSYYNNQLSKMLNPSGSRYWYTYDEKQQMTYALSTDGQQYGFTYDSKGNVTNATVTARKPAITLETGKEYYIINSFSGLAMDSGWRGVSQKVSTYRFSPPSVPQRWRLEAVSGETGVYRLRAMYYDAQNYYLTVMDSQTVNGSLMEVGTSNNTAAQKFKLVKQQDNTFAIYTGTTNYVKLLDGQYDAGTDILQSQNVKLASAGSGTLAEGKRWYFYPVETPESKVLSTDATYTASGNFVSQMTDQRGNAVKYNYTESTGLLNSVTDPLNQVTNYTYDTNLSRLTGVSSGGSSVSYTYDKDLLTEIIANNTVRYKFLYDIHGRTKGIQVGNGTEYRTLTEKTYNSSGLVNREKYGNGNLIDYTYDNFDRLTKKQYNNDAAQKVEYAYGSNGQLSQVTDYFAGTKTKYVYDLAGRAVSLRVYNGTGITQTKLKASVDYTYADKTNYLTGVKHFSDLGTQTIGYRYGNLSQGQMPDQIYGVSWNGTEKQAYTYDGLGRLTNRQVKPSTSITLNNTYTYLDAGVGKTTTLIGTASNAAGTYTYTYDAVGNIKTISDGTYLLSYQYDTLNQLVRENDQRAGKTYLYEYTNGNITKKKEYAYTVGSVSGNPIKETEWKYEDTKWGDLLTSWDGKAVVYDEIGNPTEIGKNTDKGHTYEWNGRQLVSLKEYASVLDTVDYQYNGDGQRIRKSVLLKTGTRTTTDYFYNGGILAGQKSDDGKTIVFYYDNDGEYFGFRYNGVNYYYLKNAQNDVTAIANSAGNVIVRYYYDAWGRLLSITDGAGSEITDSAHVGMINPIRYRGYYYDSETELYWLQSRYYDPQIGRFINADGQLNPQEGMTGYKLFQYCGNNPVNRIDPTGEAWWHWALAAVVVVACAVAVVATAGGATAGIAAVVAVGNGVAAATTASTIAASAFIGSSMALGGAALVAASNSKSVSDFNAQGNWGTVVGTVGGAVIGGGSAYLGTKSSSSSSSKSNSKLNKYVDNPQKIKNVEPIKIQKIAIRENLNVGTLSKGSHAGQGLKVTWGGDRLLQYHPGGGHHGPNSYWKVSSGEFGTIRIFNDK